MALFDRFRQTRTVSRVQLVTERGNGFYSWNGKIYQSDIVRAAIRPKVKAVGKLLGKHIRETMKNDGTRDIKVNPEPYIRFLLEEPNPYMTGQMLQEKLATQLCLNNNAFALILRDDNGWPTEILPITASSVEALVDRAGELFLRFILRNGKMFTFAYTDIIHLRQDFNEDDFFGDPLAPVLAPLMEIVNTTDQGIVNTIRNSAVIRWLLKFTTSTRPEDIKKATQEFAASFLDTTNGTGVAGVDSKADAIQVEPHDFVPNAAQMDRTQRRIFQLFNTNVKIVDSSRSEEEWGAYADMEVSPVVKQLCDEYTRKLFTRRERGCGNKIVFEANAWDCTTTKTKLSLVSMVDRGALTPNEWRATFNLAPVDGGDTPIRRLDTQPTTGGGETT